MTHKANIAAADAQYSQYLTRVKEFGLTYVKFFGDPQLAAKWDYDESSGALCLQCPDDYVNLPNKVFSFLTASRLLFPKAVGIFKTDDDTKIDLLALNRLLRRNSRLEYFGLVTPGTERSSNYLRNKSSVTRKYPGLAKHPVRLIPAPYCAGGGYYLNQQAIDIVLANEAFFRPFPGATYKDHLGQDGIYEDLHVFEDKTVGLVLHASGVNAVDRRRPLLRAVEWTMV